MSLHKIIDITEADFGCEEHIDGPHAVLIFEDGTKYEVSEKWISENGIEEGVSVWIDEDKSIIKAIKADTYNLERFIKEHQSTFSTAYAELSNGRKQSHWMWWIFPQVAGLGMTSTSQYYSIKSIDEAKAFLDHPYLGKNIREISEVLLSLDTNDAGRVMGYPDDLKLRSSMTLFVEAAPDEMVFQKVLDKFYDGKKDERTVSILKEI